MNPLITSWKEWIASKQPYPSPTLLASSIEDGDALSSLEEDEFQRFIREIAEKVLKSEQFPFDNIFDFLLSTQSDITNPIFDPAQHAKFSNIKPVPFLIAIKELIKRNIGAALSSRFFMGGLPNNGTCLVFTRKLKSAYLVYFDLRGEPPEIAIVARIENPTGVLEVENIARLPNPLQRNLAKAFLTSGHKLILQNGVLTHVDRRIDHGVFGPSIDTVFLSDILLQEKERLSPGRILEIGSGSGHAICVAACTFDNIGSCVSIDLSPQASYCSWRNLEANLNFRKKKIERVYGVIGPFDPVVFPRTYDLVICNPPYIAQPPNAERLEDPTKFSAAVAGTKLLREVVKQAQSLLGSSGKLLLMTSSTSLGAVVDSLPSEFKIRKAYSGNGRRVPFDVEAALGDRGWIEFLKSEGALEYDNNENTYWHDLRPVWIEGHN